MRAVALAIWLALPAVAAWHGQGLDPARQPLALLALHALVGLALVGLTVRGAAGAAASERSAGWGVAACGVAGIAAALLLVLGALAGQGAAAGALVSGATGRLALWALSPLVCTVVLAAAAARQAPDAWDAAEDVVVVVAAVALLVALVGAITAWCLLERLPAALGDGLLQPQHLVHADAPRWFFLLGLVLVDGLLFRRRSAVAGVARAQRTRRRRDEQYARIQADCAARLESGEAVCGYGLVGAPAAVGLRVATEVLIALAVVLAALDIGSAGWLYGAPWTAAHRLPVWGLTLAAWWWHRSRAWSPWIWGLAGVGLAGAAAPVLGGAGALVCAALALVAAHRERQRREPPRLVVVTERRRLVYDLDGVFLDAPRGTPAATDLPVDLVCAGVARPVRRLGSSAGVSPAAVFAFLWAAAVTVSLDTEVTRRALVLSVNLARYQPAQGTAPLLAVQACIPGEPLSLKLLAEHH